MEICAVGGYNEVGKNMTAVKIGDEVIIIDMGFYLPAIVNLEEEEKPKVSLKQLEGVGAIPDDSSIADWKDKVKAIIIGHCHLDHCGAVPYLAEKYKCPVYGTPFTIEVIKSILEDEKIRIKNDLRKVEPNSIVKITENIKLELIGITHSTPQSAMVLLDTKEGKILYCNDFKFDNYPTLGKKPNYERLRKLANENVVALISESLYAAREGKTPSEKIARELLMDVLLNTNNKGKAIFVTTFASHLERISSVIEFSKILKRQIIFVGRSMAKYINAAERVNVVKFSKEGAVIGYSKQIKKELAKIQKNKDKYIVVCTGSQGEPNSILDKIVRKQIEFSFSEGDQVIFSCKTIPDPLNIANRELLESRLKKSRVRIFTDIHSSGHASSEDLRDLIDMVKPRNVIPSHGDNTKLNALAEIAKECGYKMGKDIHLMYNGKRIKL